MILEIRDLTYDIKTGGIFKGRSYRLIDGFNLDVEEGERITIYGDRYSGKYHLIRMITNMIKPTSGKVYYRGINILALSKQRLYDIRRKIQTIFQDPIGMFDEKISIYDNIRWFGEVADIKDYTWIINEVIRGFVKEDLKRIFPHQLSFLDRQIISIARSMMLNPEILLLENPTLFINWDHKDRFLEFLDYINQEYNFTIITFTSDISFLRKYGDRVGILHMGRLIELGDRDDVVSNPHHPYTKLLMQVDEKIVDAGDVKEFSEEVLSKYIEGCRYVSCRYRKMECDKLMISGGDKYFVKCVLYKE